jgi:D-beta-D-heptose 7-phosphate kinase/D-beta-D-heptose 1-phosphate adenosyltransferase
MHDLMEKLERFGHPRVLLVGDFILDRYVYGDVDRINPEAPVPVLNVVRREARVGGAGNVAAAVGALEGQAVCVGVIGQDAAGGELLELLEKAGPGRIKPQAPLGDNPPAMPGASSVDVSGLVQLANRPTAIKTRYVGLAQHRNAQQMLRVDEENAEPISTDVESSLLAAVRERLAAADIVVLEDYNKGVLSGGLAARIIAMARQAGKRVVVDPACIADYSRYCGATVLKPNRYEAALAGGIEIRDNETLAAAAEKLLQAADAQAVIVSLDREGAYCRRRGQEGRRIPHQCPREVYDVTGAGDETLAALAVALAEGLDYEQAEELANVAGGLEVEQFGFVPITRGQIAAELRRMIGLRGGKVLARAALAREVAHRRARGETIAFTNGVFDLLHMGHVNYLQQARELGSCLIVAINSDASVRRLKGPTRPVIGQQERAGMLAALECVDYVTIFDEETPMALLELLRPDVLIKGGTTPVVVGRELVESYGGKVTTMAPVAGLSTTEIINRIMGNGSK